MMAKEPAQSVAFLAFAVMKFNPINQMKSTKLILCLVAALSTQALAGDGRRIPIHGQWDQWNPSELRTDAVLDRNHSYTITNNTKELIYVWLVEQDQTPREYFPLGVGESWQFVAPWNLEGETYSLDLFMLGQEGDKLNGNSLVLREGLEFATN